MKQTPVKSTLQGKKGKKSNVSLNDSKQSKNESDVSVKQNHNLHAIKGGKIGKMTPHKKPPAKKNKVDLLLKSNEGAGLMKKTPLKKLQGKSKIEKSSKIENGDEEEEVTTLTARNPKKMPQSKKNAKEILQPDSDDEDINEDDDIEEDVDEQDDNMGNASLESDADVDNDDDDDEGDNDDDEGNDDDEDEDGNVDDEDGNDVDDEDGNDVDDDDDDDNVSFNNLEEVDEDDEQDTVGEEDQYGDDDNIKKPLGKKKLITKLRKGRIPEDYPNEKIVHVSNVPKGCKVVDILEAFSKFGTIYMINIMRGEGMSAANVAFQTVQAAQAAIASTKKIELQGFELRVTANVNYRKKKEESEHSMKRTICIKKLLKTTTENDLKKHFSSCGDIETIELFPRNKLGFAFIRFKNENAVEKALLLDNSILNDYNIVVKRRILNDTAEADNIGQDAENTIAVNNTQNLQSIDVQNLRDIFGKCGQIKKIKVICGANILAFITFNNSKAVEKAFTLDNTEQNGIQIKLEHCIPPNKTAIYVTNLAPEVTNEDLEKLFSTCGEIKSILLKRASAIVYFKNSDAFCKSFLLNEHRLKNRMIFLKPYSNLEKVTLNASHAKKRQKNAKRQMMTPQQKFRSNVANNNNNNSNNKNKRLKMSS